MKQPEPTFIEIFPRFIRKKIIEVGVVILIIWFLTYGIFYAGKLAENILPYAFLITAPTDNSAGQTWFNGLFAIMTSVLIIGVLIVFINENWESTKKQIIKSKKENQRRRKQ